MIIVERTLRDIVDPGEGKIIRAADKNSAAVKAPATCSIIAATNFTHALDLPPTDRRVLVIDNTVVPEDTRRALRVASEDWHCLAAAAAYCMERTWTTGEQAYAEPHRNAATVRMMSGGVDDIGSIEELFQRAVMPKEGEDVFLPGAVYVWPQLLAAVELLMKRFKRAHLSDEDKGLLRRLAVQHAPDHDKRERRYRDSPLLRDGFLADKMPDGGSKSVFEMWMSPHADPKIWSPIIGKRQGRRPKEAEQRLDEALRMNDAVLLEHSPSVSERGGKVVPLRDR